MRFNPVSVADFHFMVTFNTLILYNIFNGVKIINLMPSLVMINGAIILICIRQVITMDLVLFSTMQFG